ncbi:MAG: hypothetical protein NT031_15100, partial [Planctomycetota bacterium]|nr:hypothetical protein [Planctomycetota bacterium]
GGGVFQNVTYVDPPQGMPSRIPMTHFRHTDSTTNALCADGHAQNFAIAEKDLIDSDNDLSSVGTTNRPHYDNKNP